MFKNKHFPTLIYLGILITLLALTFNLIDIFQKSRNMTGYAVSEPTISPIKQFFKNVDLKAFVEEKIQLNEETPSMIYNGFVMIISIASLLILIRFIYKAQD